MDAQQLKELQSPLKAQHAASSASAIAQLHARGTINLKNLTCEVETPGGDDECVTSGLHPLAGGDGTNACSGDMLLQSLVACSGVTFAAVATAMELNVQSARIEAIGTMDFRGTLGVDREVPVGLTKIELSFHIDSEEPADRINKLIQLTERYCVVLQTLKQGAEVTSGRAA